MKAQSPSPVELSGVLWVSWLALAAVVLSATGADPDLWGHVRFGLDWLHTRRLPLEDPYSFMQDRPWINHEWLSEAAMGAAYSMGGCVGLVLLKVAVVAAALAVVHRRLRDATPLVAASVLAFAIVCVIPISLTVRPQLWSLLGLACLASIVDAPGAPGYRQLALCALVFALWANLHGGWITGAALLAAYSTVRAARRPAGAARWIALAAIGILATLINPYGIGLWRFLASTVRASRPDISEWQPMGLDSPLILWVPIAGVLLLGGILSRNRETRPSAAVWTALLLLTFAALRVHRVAPLMGPASLVLLAPCIVRAWGHRFRLHAPNPEAALVLWIPAIVALLAVARPLASSFSCLRIAGDWSPDLAVAPSLESAGGRLWTTFDWGEYAIWHFGPELRVSVDGRRETVYSNGVIQLHRAFERGDPSAQRRVKSLSPEYVWLPSSRSQAREWLAATGYRIDLASEMSFIAVRSDLPRLVAAPAARPCFP